MKLFLAHVICLLSFSISYSQTPIPSGTVSGTWNLAGSPYQILGSIQIPNGQTLVVDPGVTINFQGAYKLTVLGQLLAVGTATDSIIFTAASTTTGWRGIRFNSTAATNDTSRFGYCKLEYGKASGSGWDNAGGAFYILNFSKVIISNSRMTNCTSVTGGAAIMCHTCNPIIRNNTISNCSAGFDGGGGIYTLNSSTVITNNLIRNNICTDCPGGGIYASGGNPVISWNAIQTNTAVTTPSSQGGGGISYQGSGQPVISNNTVSGNTAENGGGISFDSGGDPFLFNNIICNNIAPGKGGGIHVGAGLSLGNFYNNVIANNTALHGGGLYLFGTSDSAIMNTSIVNNSASQGGGIYFRQNSGKIRNSIIWGNTVSTGGAQVFLFDDNYNPDFYHCDIQGGQTAFDANGGFYSGNYQNNLDLNPLFVSPSGGSGTGFNGLAADWSLQNSSPCIDAGNPLTTTPVTDLAGNPRVTVCRIDMGAYEYQSGVPFGVTISQTAAILCNGYTTGALQANLSGGASPYTYSWSAAGATTSAISNLAAGDYSVSVSFAGGCTRTASFTITEPVGMNLSTNKTDIDCSGNCIGSATVSVTGGTSPFTYFWNTSPAQSTSATTANLCSGDYSVAVTDVGGCSKTGTVSITTPSALGFSTTLVNVSCLGGNNGSITVNASGGTGGYQYSKDAGVNYQASNIFTGLTASTYSIVVKDGAGCITSSNLVSITAPPLLTTVATQTNVPCYGSSMGGASAIVSGGTAAYTYSWNTVPVKTTASVSGLSPGNYLVSVTDSKGCTSTASVTIISAIPNPVICSVTVDSLSDFNIIVWDKTPMSGGAVDSFVIYRDTANNNFAQIGKVPFSALSEFTDTVRTLYPANGDPNVSSWRYKIAALDTCGNISSKSPYHQTIFIQNNSGNFSWNQYQIEGQPTPVPPLNNYLFQRDDLSLGNYVTIQSLSASSTAYTDPAYATYQATATWRVRTNWTITCTPTVKDPEIFGTIKTTKSNTFKTGVVSVKEKAQQNLVSVYPNPSPGKFTVQVDGRQYTVDNNSRIKIFDMLGQLIFADVFSGSKMELNLDVLDGIYFIHLVTESGVFVGKIAIGR